MKLLEHAFRAAFIAVCCGVSSLSPLFGAGQISAQTFSSPDNSFRVGQWEGAAQFLADGKFFACLMVSDYADGESVAFGINQNYSFWFGLSSKKWNLNQRERYRIVYEIENFTPVHVVASAPFPNMVMSDFPDDERTFQQLRAAQIMTVKIVDLREEVKLDLQAIDKAMPILLDCVDRNTGSSAGNSFRNANPRNEERVLRYFAQKGVS